MSTIKLYTDGKSQNMVIGKSGAQAFADLSADVKTFLKDRLIKQLEGKEKLPEELWEVTIEATHASQLENLWSKRIIEELQEAGIDTTDLEVYDEKTGELSGAKIDVYFMYGFPAVQHVFRVYADDAISAGNIASGYLSNSDTYRVISVTLQGRVSLKGRN